METDRCRFIVGFGATRMLDAVNGLRYTMSRKIPGLERPSRSAPHGLLTISDSDEYPWNLPEHPESFHEY
jgi:hypothetical protein